MTQAASVSTPQTANDTLTDIEINVSVLTIDGADRVVVSPQYIEVPEKTGVRLSWTLTPRTDIEVQFDTPAVTMFGEGANVTWHPPTINRREATWFNTEEVQGRSYSYRVHLLKKVGDEIFPLVTDPIVHNDPPSAP